jgi:hypothetical protein
MKKIICRFNDGAEEYLTVDKYYETDGMDNCGQYPTIADNGELMAFDCDHFILAPPTDIPDEYKDGFDEFEIKYYRCSCLWCDWKTNDCRYKFDPYNTDGDCLMEK